LESKVLTDLSYNEVTTHEAEMWYHIAVLYCTKNTHIVQ